MVDLPYVFVRMATPDDGKVRAMSQLSLWARGHEEPREEVWLAPAEVQSLGLTDVMRTALAATVQGPGVPVPQEPARSPDVRPASGSEDSAVSADNPLAWAEESLESGSFIQGVHGPSTGADGMLKGVRPTHLGTWDEAVARSRESDPVQDTLDAAKHLLGPSTGAQIEATVGGGQTADGWRWWVIDDATVAYDNRPQIEAFWREVNGRAPTGVDEARAHTAAHSANQPNLHQSVVPLSLLSFIFDPDNGVAMSQSVDDVKLHQQRADVALYFERVEALGSDDEGPWGLGYGQALIDLKAELLARFGKPEARPLCEVCEKPIPEGQEVIHSEDGDSYCARCALDLKADTPHDWATQVHLADAYRAALREVEETPNDLPEPLLDRIGALLKRQHLGGRHLPRRDDDVAAWLKRMRDATERPGHVGGKAWHAVNRLLDRYRECADHGLSLRPEDDGAGDP